MKSPIMKTVVIYSGGLDSTVLLYHLMKEKHAVRCLGINYGQRHHRELQAAEQICQGLNIEYQMADLRGLRPLLACSALTSDLEVPEGHYAADNMKLTVVPNRNMIMLSVAIGWAVNLKFDAVAYAAHSGDHTIYPDCRPEFIDLMDQAARRCDWHSVRVLRPFVDMTKADIVRHGAELNVPFDQTWSCYKGEDVHCGRCGTCVERREAFKLAEVDDPTFYART
jgi:7-cyano-7-deazaguanine synthase